MTEVKVFLFGFLTSCSVWYGYSLYQILDQDMPRSGVNYVPGNGGGWWWMAVEDGGWWWMLVDVGG